MKKPKAYKPPRSSNRQYVSPIRVARQELYRERDWIDYRYRFLHHNPTCYICGDKSTIVDHIQPHKGDRPLFENTSNHLPLCVRCHNTITALFDREDSVDVVAKVEWITAKRTNTSSIKVIRPYRKRKY